MTDNLSAMTTKKSLYFLISLIVLGAILRIAWAVSIYNPSLLPYHGGDYNLYRIGAEEILAKGFDFSNSLFLVRPPGFPLIVATLGINEWAILSVNLIFGIMLIPLTYSLAREINLSRQLSLLSALLITLDLTSIKYSAVLLAEPIANLLLLLGLIALIRCQRKNQFGLSLAWGVGSACLIVLSAYMRPAAYILWLPIVIWFIGVNIKRGRRWFIGIVIVGIIIGGTGLWTTHNQRVFNHGTFSSIGVYNLAYYRAASVLYQGDSSNPSITEVYTRIARDVEATAGNDTRGITAERRYSHTSSSALISDALVSVSVDIFLDYPLYYVLTIPVGMVRILITTATFWMPLYVFGILWNAILMILVVAGLLKLWLSKQYQFFWLVVLVSGYFIAGTLLVQTSGIDTRARSMLTPLFVVTAVCSIGWRGYTLFDE